MQILFKILVNGTLLCFLWVLSIMVSNSLLKVQPPEAGNPSTVLFFMWLCCVLEAAALHLYMVNCRLTGGLRGLGVFIILFSIQFVFTQMETVYFLDDQTIPYQVVLASLLAGLFSSLLFSLYLAYRYPEKLSPAQPYPHTKKMSLLVIILGVIVYPAIYFLAGYFIAWQSEAVRIYYTGSPELASFPQIMAGNFQSGLYYFQVFRGIIWTLLGLAILYSLVPRQWTVQGLVLGILFALLMSSQLLLPNPYMPDQIRVMHAVETSTSNFIWGMVIAFSVHRTR
jgi:hypothetical protein